MENYDLARIIISLAALIVGWPWLSMALKFRFWPSSLIPIAFCASIVLFNIAVYVGGISPEALNFLSNIVRALGLSAVGVLGYYLNGRRDIVWKNKRSP